jgi:hypothetical protein
MRYENLFWLSISQWKKTAGYTVRALETGREALGVCCEHHAGHNGKRKLTVQWFLSFNDTLIQEAKNLNIDPRPFQAIADVLNAWNHPWYTPEIPDQEHLLALFDAALATIPEIERGIRRREAERRPVSAPRPVVPVVTVDGRHESRNGAVIEPVARDLKCRRTTQYDVKTVEPLSTDPEVPNRSSSPELDSKLIDDRELARTLRGKRAHMQARVVEYMGDKSEADYEDLSEHLYPGQEVDDQRIRSLVRGLIHSTEGLKTASVYSQASGRVYRDTRT